MSKVAVIAKLVAQAGKRDDLENALKTALDTASGEAGTLVYALHRDNKESDILWFYELYTDEDALKAHSSSDAFKALGPAIGAFLAGRPELHMLSPVGGKGI